MSEQPFDKPRIAVNRVYTRGGDGGETGLAGGQRLPKDALRIESYGQEDELNTFLGAARATVEDLAARQPAVAPRRRRRDRPRGRAAPSEGRAAHRILRP